MAISTVRVQVNGTWTSLTYNSSSGKWEGTISAPATTSYNQPNKYYPVTVEASNSAGTVTTKDDTDPTLGEDLKLTVKEKIKPVITLTSPSSGAYVKNANQPVEFTVTDETSGSGVKLSSLVLKIDSDSFTSASVGMTCTPTTNGYSVTYTPQTALAEGSHTITIDCDDNDGNSAVTATATFTVDTVPPTLNVSAPTDNLETNTASLTVTGTTNDTTSSPTTVTIELNGADVGTVTVAADGSFSKAISLASGSNTIKVTATDTAGQTNEITRTVIYDNSTPNIKSVTISPNPVDTSGTVIISVEVE